MAKKKFPILLSVGSLGAYGYEHVGSLEVMGCCKFDVWQRSETTAISIVGQCADCLGKLRSMVGSRAEHAAATLGEVVDRSVEDSSSSLAAASSGSGPWLLAVVDEAQSLQALSLLLREDGYHVEGVSSAPAALALLAGKPDDRPCLILIDLTAPERAGWLLAKELDAEPALATIPRCIVVSDSKPGFSLFATVLPHPLDVDRLFEVVQRFCGREDGEPGSKEPVAV